ncbi:S-layer homology domain-containing protein [Paenibacillus sp. HWE-109]|uniref:S-layer homology domain-containing protein n=1 Tax=Paenibacillus sp. HWE-109 TaxID=1306526 RepID=UPI001EE033AD|nr:S-layer homology domain-containing protein [Paenibacillus sp. HWE-109]UKS28112.1 S-layer homology domain-containing protein [Paenibacillus sp. HWE-109]
MSQIKLGTLGTSFKVKDNITVPIMALDTKELMGLQFSIKYDPGIFDFMEGDTVLSSGFYSVDANSNILIDEQNGILKYALIKNQIPGKDTIPQIKIADLHFKALKAADSTSIKIDEITATTGYAQIPTNSQDTKQTKINDDNGNGPVDTEKPVVLIQSSNATNSPTYVLKGTVTDNDPKVSLTINGAPVTLNNSTFEKSFTLTEGANSFTLIAADSAGNKQENTFVVTYTKSGSGGGGGSTGTGTGSGNGTVNSQDPEFVSVQIVAATGGTIQLGTKVKVVIPAHALKEDAKITIRRLADLDKTSEGERVLQIGSHIYEITTTGDKNLNKPMTLSLTPDPNKIKNGKEPAIYYYQEDRKQWIYLGEQDHHAIGEMSTEIVHFAKFAVFTDETIVKLNDVNNHWAAVFIDRLVGMKVINGYEDQTFRPENNVTRAEFTSMIVSALGLAVGKDASPSFADTDQIPSWAKGYVKAAVDAGIIEGRAGADGGTYFDADALITRAEMAVMITRVLHTTPSGSALSFTDANDIPDWAKSSIAHLVKEEIINGFEDNTFRSNANATRSQAASMIYKLLVELGI